MRAVLLLAVALICIAPSMHAQTDDQTAGRAKKQYLYEWTDGKGQVHITDNFTKIPERYRSDVRKLESRKGEEPGPGQRYEVPSASSEEDQAAEAEEDAKFEWQQRMQDWRARLADAEKRCQDLERERALLLGGYGTADNLTLENKAKVLQIEQQMREARKAADEAQNMITNVIPDEARKAGVPPGWLRE